MGEGGNVRQPAEVQSQLKAALRRLAKSVVVISCAHDGQRFAMAATAVTEISMEPPAMLACVNRNSSIHTPLAAGADFCLNILHGSHEEISALCSGKAGGEQRFAVGQWEENETGIPFLADAQANIFCRCESFLTRGSHSIFMGDVVAARQSGDVAPLVYLDGRYAAFGGPPA